MRKTFCSLLLLLILSACTLGRKDQALAPALYDFGPAPSVVAGGGLASSLALEVRMPLWMASSPAMHYRLLYHDQVRLYEYASARWAGTPSNLVHQRLSQQLGITSRSSGGSVSCRLFLDIAEFGQMFDRPNQSHALIAGEARMLGKGGQILALRRIRIEKPAQTQNAPGGVMALAQGLDDLAADISVWLRQLEGGTKISSCRG